MAGNAPKPSMSYVYHYLMMSPVDDTMPDFAYWLKAKNDSHLQGMNPEEVVLILINRGTTQHLFRNPYIEARLAKMGLLPETAFGCAMDYLFEPLPHVQQLLANDFRSLSRSVQLTEHRVQEVTSYAKNKQARMWLVSPLQQSIRPEGALVISIQIRVGDEVMKGNAEVDLEKVEAAGFFSCARHIEEEHRLPGQEVLWFVISDDPVVRAYAVSQYGSKVVTQVNATVQHAANNSLPPPDPDHALSVQGMRTAIAEHWAFGMGDFHIITKKSGFGRTAAFRSKRTRFSLYTIDPTSHERTDCSVGGHTTLTEASLHWFGI